MSKPILCLDFDGVCHMYTSGWKGANVIPDPPVPGLFEFLGHACEHFDVQIFSSRTGQPGGVDAMKVWFNSHHAAWLVGTNRTFQTLKITFPEKKPPALVTIDDRCIQFDGVFPDVEGLLAFKPWNNRGV